MVEALRVVKQRISNKKHNLSLKMMSSATLPSGYKPELDVSKFVGHETAIFYMQLIGILRWLVELGRIGICAEVSMMSAYIAICQELGIFMPCFTCFLTCRAMLTIRRSLWMQRK